MIQIFKIRKGATRFWDLNYNSVKELFINFEHVAKAIPEDERYNIYFTVGSCDDENEKRKIITQDIIPIDIDDIDTYKYKEYHEIILGALDVDYNSTGIVFTGNGLQYFIGTNEKITDTKHFSRTKPLYNALCDKIDAALLANGLDGSADRKVWSPARLMRVPFTTNIKNGKKDTKAHLIQANIDHIDYKMEEVVKLPSANKDDFFEGKFPTPDHEEIIAACPFIKNGVENPADLDEENWYKFLSIVTRFQGGIDLAHEYSQDHPKYSYNECEKKIKHSMEFPPRTCKNICQSYDGCYKCPYFEKIKSPITIVGKSYIKTQDTGFHDTIITASTGNSRKVPNYEDLRRYFEKKYSYCVSDRSGLVYTWSKKHWEDIPPTRIKAFAQEHFNPVAVNQMVAEFIGIVGRTNPVKEEYFDHEENLFNFKNGILDLKTMDLGPHDKSHGFRHVLDFDYDPDAECPVFDKYLNDVTLGRVELQKACLEFMGFALAGGPCKPAKALILLGEGRNGKTKIIELMQKLGKGCCSNLTLSDMASDQHRYQLHGKLFNLGDETGKGSMWDNSIFKTLTDGGTVSVKLLYSQPFEMKNRAKLIMNCNEMPRSSDTTAANYRRMLIIPFDAKFDEDDPQTDPHIDIKMEKELPGIFNRIVTEYKAFLKNGRRFTTSPEIRGELEEYKESNDNVRSWYNETCTLSGDHQSEYSTLNDLYADYTLTSQERNEKPINYNMFCKRVKAIVPSERFKRRAIENKKISIIEGLTFQSQY